MANYFCELPCLLPLTPSPPLPSPLSTLGALLDPVCPGQGAEAHCPAFLELTKGRDSPTVPFTDSQLPSPLPLKYPTFLLRTSESQINGRSFQLTRTLFSAAQTHFLFISLVSHVYLEP